MTLSPPKHLTSKYHHTEDSHHMDFGGTQIFSLTYKTKKKTIHMELNKAHIYKDVELSQNF